MSSEAATAPPPGDARSDSGRTRALAWIGVALGLALFAVQIYLLEGYLKQGLQEFAYFPFTPESLPFSPMRGFTYEQLAEHIIRFVLGLPALLLLTFGLAHLVRASAPDEALQRRLVWAVAIMSLLLIAMMIVLLFNDRPITDDELTYRYQADLLATGRLGDRSVPFISPEPFTVEGTLGYTGKYLPGEPLVQVPGTWIGVPALLHLPLAALTLWMLHRLVALIADRQQAGWAVILLALSPMFLFTTPTGMSQATSLFCTVGAGLGYVWCDRHRPLAGAALLSACLGLGIATRPQAALPIGLILGPVAAYRLLRKRRWLALGILVGVAVLGAGGILAYNHAITGEALKLPWFLSTPPEHYGFGRVWLLDPFRHTAYTMLQNLGVTLVRFNAWWLGWPCSLLVIGLWFRLGRPAVGGWIWAAMALAVVAFEAAYYSTGVSDTGPIYHYELLLPASLLGAAVLARAAQRAPRLLWVGLAVHLLLGTLVFVQYHYRRLDRLTTAIHEDAEKLLHKIPGRALLFHEEDCSEVLHIGWIYSSFPKRYRLDRYRVVTYPRPPLSQLRAYLKHYHDRDCWYLHRAPARGGPLELLPCSRAARYFARAVFLQGRPCISIRSTAEKKGWYDPIQANRQRLRISGRTVKGTAAYRRYIQETRRLERRAPGLYLPPPQVRQLRRRTRRAPTRARPAARPPRPAAP